MWLVQWEYLQPLRVLTRGCETAVQAPALQYCFKTKRILLKISYFKDRTGI